MLETDDIKVDKDRRRLRGRIKSQDAETSAFNGMNRRGGQIE